jgi:hypothetical protein
MSRMKDLFGDTPFDPLARGHEAAEMAADHAGEDWKEMAYSAFVSHARDVLGTFTTEEVRAAYPSVPPPPDKRAWGQVALRAKRAKVVHATGITKVGAHGRYGTLWVLA